MCLSRIITEEEGGLMYTTTVALLCVSSVRSLGASLGAGLSVQEGQPTGRDQCPVPRPVLE